MKMERTKTWMGLAALGASTLALATTTEPQAADEQIVEVEVVERIDGDARKSVEAAIEQLERALRMMNGLPSLDRELRIRDFADARGLAELRRDELRALPFDVGLLGRIELSEEQQATVEREVERLKGLDPEVRRAIARELGGGVALDTRFFIGRDDEAFDVQGLIDRATEGLEGSRFFLERHDDDIELEGLLDRAREELEESRIRIERDGGSIRIDDLLSGKARVFLSGPGTTGRVDIANLRKLFEGLTDEQRELMDDRGYLKYDDLSKDQRELLGEMTGRIRILLDDEELELRKD